MTSPTLNQDEPDSCTASADVQPADTATAWAVSLWFWSALLLAAAVYATVALAPKFAVWNQVRHEYRHNAAQLIALEQDVDYLERVQHALETDPEFVARLAGLSDPQSGGDEEFIPVSGTLLFGYAQDEAMATPQLPDVPPGHRLAMTFATNIRLRTCLLTFSALLTVFAFTFLNDAGSSLVQSAGRLAKATALLPVRRYFQPVTEESETPPDISDRPAF